MPPPTLERVVLSSARAGAGVRSGVPLAQWLALGVLAEASLLLLLLRQDPQVVQRLSRWSRSRAEAKALAVLKAKDLALGSAAPPLRIVRPASGPTSPTVATIRPQGRPHVLLFIGSCSACAGSDLAAVASWRVSQSSLQPGESVRSGRKPPTEPHLLVVTQDTTERAAQFLKTSKLRLDLVCDDNGASAKAYNAAFLPRAYLVDARGRLRWRQESPGSAQEAVSHAMREAER